MSVTCHHVSMDELVTLNDSYAFTFSSMGLKDRELDEAIVASLHPALKSLGSLTRKTQTDAIEGWRLWIETRGPSRAAFM